MQTFRNEEYLWWQVAEYSHDTFMIRSRTRGWTRRWKKLISIVTTVLMAPRCREFDTTIGLTEMTGDVL
jgi:hypothetical protein